MGTLERYMLRPSDKVAKMIDPFVDKIGFGEEPMLQGLVHSVGIHIRHGDRARDRLNNGESAMQPPSEFLEHALKLLGNADRIARKARVVYIATDTEKVMVDARKSLRMTGDHQRLKLVSSASERSGSALGLDTACSRCPAPGRRPPPLHPSLFGAAHNRT